MVAWSEWLESKTDEWELFTLTVVFRAGGKIARLERWESEYKNRVLAKIRRALERNKKNHETAIPYEEFFYYEFDESSIFRSSGLRKPHHIHALIPIRKTSVYRFWSIDNSDLQDRLKKDIYSLDTIGPILVEPLERNKAIDWITYCLKGKQHI